MQATPANTNQVDFQHSEIPKLSQPPSKAEHYFHLWTYYLTLIWERTVIVLLSLMSLHALYTSARFITTDYPKLEELLQAKVVQTAEVTTILTEAISLMLATIISILFAIRISRGHDRVSRVFELLLGSALIIWYQPILAYLKALDYQQITLMLRALPLFN